MPDTNSLRAGVTLLSLTLCAVAPMLTSSDQSLDKLLLVFAGGALPILAGRLVNAMTERAAERKRARLPDTGVLLRNDSLSKLAAESLKRAFDGAAQAFGKNRELIHVLAQQVPAYLEAVRNAPPEALATHDLPNLAVRLDQARTSPGSGAHILRTDWENLIDDLAARAESPAGFTIIRSALAQYLASAYDRIVLAVLKEDAAGRGPMEGRGWASLTLLFWGRLLADVKELHQQASGNQDELLIALQDTEDRLAAKLDRLIRWFGPEAASSDGLASWLQSVHRPLANKLDELTALLTHGLMSPESFRLQYWSRRRSDYGLETLWRDVDRAAILTNDIVGRSAEVADFEQFLSSSQSVQFWKGFPGTGKSRLTIEFAQRATAAGRQVFFVRPDAAHLETALVNVASSEPIVLIWDDYRGDQPDALRVFLELLPADPTKGPNVKRVITSWPTLNLLAGKHADPRFVQRNLQAVVPPDELISYTQRLLPKLKPGDAGKLVRRAESHPEAVHRAIVLVLAGTPMDRLPPNLLEAAYDDLIQRLLERHPNLKTALRALALIGSVNLGDAEQERAIEAAGVSSEALGALIEIGVAARIEEVYSLDLDSFRAHIVRRSLDNLKAEVLSGNPGKLAEFARPLLAEWFHEIWGICVLAASDPASHGPEIRDALLAAFDKELAAWPIERCTTIAQQIVNATAVEPDPRQREALANRIAELLKQYPSPEIALAEAQALFNATVVEPDPRQREALANRIAELLKQYPSPEIALAQAKALYNATVVEPDPRQREALANRIAELLKQYPSPEIALAQAKALFNATAVEPDPRQREALANRIAELLDQYPSPEIALAQAQALHNATAVEPDPRQREALANRIAELETKYSFNLSAILGIPKEPPAPGTTG